MQKARRGSLYGEAQFFNAKGNDVSINVQQMIDEYSLPFYRKMFNVLEGKGSNAILKSITIPDNTFQELEKEIRSLRIAIDMALDLGCKEDFLALTEKYNELIKKIGENEYEI